MQGNRFKSSLRNKELDRQILRLTIPNIITNITIPLLGMVDTAIVGHIEYSGATTDYIGAVAIGSMIFNFLYWGFGFLRMGTSGFTAQAYGAKDRNEQVDIITRALIIGLSVAFVILCIQKPIALLATLLIEDKNSVMSLALDYFFVRVWAAPAVLGMYAIKGWFIGMQDSKTPMWTAILINVVNIVFDIIFVFGFGMTVKGVALATVISQYSGLLLISTIFVVKHKKNYVVSIRRALQIDKMKLFFKVNSDIFLRTVCIIVVTTYFTIASSSYAYPTLAVNTLIMQLFSLFSYFMDGFAYACESLCGKYYGARDKDNLRKVVNRVILWGVGLAVVCAMLYGCLGKEILSILTSHTDVVEASEKYRIWMVLIPICGFLAFLYDGILVGMTQSKIMRNAIIVATILFFFAYFAFGKTVNALWLGFILYLLGRSIMMPLLARKQIYK